MHLSLCKAGSITCKLKPSTAAMMLLRQVESPTSACVAAGEYETEETAPTVDEATEVILRALSLGISFLNTSDLYGPFENERRIGARSGYSWRLVCTWQHTHDNTQRPEAVQNCVRTPQPACRRRAMQPAYILTLRSTNCGGGFANTKPCCGSA